MALVSTIRGVQRHRVTLCSSLLLSPFTSSGVSRAFSSRTTSSPFISVIQKFLEPPHRFSLQKRNLAAKPELTCNVEKCWKRKFDTLPQPSSLYHIDEPKDCKNVAALTKVSTTDLEMKQPTETYVLPHPIWSDDQLNSVQITHKEPEGFVDKVAYSTVQFFRAGFDLFSRFNYGTRNDRKWLNRICFLETVAAVPGMMAAVIRHLRSLRRMKRDYGWIHTLLEEAENERMHLLTALQLRQPSILFRLCVIGSQGAFVTLFALSYIISAKFCHRFVGYLEEEAVKTYTKCLEDIDHGPMKHWKTQAAPEVAITYWKLKADATMRDVILAIRADEAHHRVVNHNLASLRKDEFNPYKAGQ